MTDTTAQLYLVTPPVDDARAFARQLEAALAGGDVACLLIVTSPGLSDTDLADLVRAAQAHGTAVLLGGNPALAVRVGADGAHVTEPDRLADTIRRIKPDGIVGAGNLPTRDDAMTAGESGIDYVMFGDGPDAVEPFDTRLDRVAWWAEIFQVPCVALARHLDEVAPLAEAGAEFVALDEVVWHDPDGVAAAVVKAREAVTAGSAAFAARHVERAR